MHIAIVEDDQNTSSEIRGFLERYADENSIGIRISVFADGTQILERYTASYNLIFLDIQMAVLDGMTTAERIRERDPDVAIVFVTNLAQFAMKGYSVSALDYILKPVNYITFSQKMMKFISKLEKKEDQSILIPVKNGSRKIPLKNIYYIETNNHKLLVHTKDENILSASTISMKTLEPTLVKHGFCRCNRSYWVNLKYVNGIHGGSAIVNGEHLIISRPKKNDFLKALANYIGDEI